MNASHLVRKTLVHHSLGFNKETKGRQADRPMDLAQAPLSNVKPRGCSLRGLCLSQMSDGDCSHQTSSQQTHIGPNKPWQIFKEFSLLKST